MTHFKEIIVPLGIEGEEIIFNYLGLRTGNFYVQNLRKLEEIDGIKNKDKETENTINNLLKIAQKQLTSESKEIVDIINNENLNFDLATYITKSKYKIKNKFFVMDYLFKNIIDGLNHLDRYKFTSIPRLITFNNKLTESYGNLNPKIYSVGKKEHILIISDYVSLYKLATIAYLLKDKGVKDINILSLEKVEI